MKIALLGKISLNSSHKVKKQLLEAALVSNVLKIQKNNQKSKPNS